MEQRSWTVSDLFSICLELPRQERDALLRDLAVDQADVVAQVRELIEVHDRHPEFLEHSALDHATAVVESPAPGKGEKSSWLRTRPTAFWVLIAIDLVAIAFYVFTAAMIAHYGTQTLAFGFDTEWANGWQVSSVDAGGPAANKLAVGDRIVAFNGDWRVSGTGLMGMFQTVSPGIPYTVRVMRDNVQRDFTLLPQIRLRNRRWGDVFSWGLVSLAFFVTALILGLLKSEQKLAQRGYAALMAEALVLAKSLIVSYLGFLHGAPLVIFLIFDSLDGVHFAIGYYFYCTLFDRAIRSRAWNFVLYILAPWGALNAVLRIVIERGGRLALLDAYPSVMRAGFVLESLFYTVAPLCICAVIWRNYFKVTEPDDRRRARWIAFASLGGILPYTFVRLIGFIIEQIANPWEVITNAYQDAVRVSIILAIMIPAATGYAIYKHRMFDIRVVVRRGVRYMLAKSVLQAIIALPALGLVFALVNNAHKTVADAIWNNVSFIAWLALLAVILKFRVPLRRWLDRRFFRESYQREQLLLSLIDGVQKLHSLPEMARTVGEKVTAAFHPETVVILYRTQNRGGFTAAHPTDADIRLAANSPLLCLLEKDGEARHPGSLHGLPAADLRRLDALGVDLAVPLNAASGDLVGVILLGKKLADEPYTTEDCRLLTALASQMAMVYENLSLHQMLDHQQRTAEGIRTRLQADGIDGFRECPQCGRCYDLDVLRCVEDGSEPEFSLPIRRTVDRYRLERLIGKGGMGAVYEAEDLSLGRRVAVKIIAASALENPIAFQRVQREARAVARLNHPNIIATYDFGVLPNGVAYLVMELVPGETLREAMYRGPVDPGTAAAWLDQLMAGVEEAHRAGIVHRDLKPENVLISASPDGNPLVKILDFGIAKAAVPEMPGAASLTIPGTVLGSIQYMSPEQLNGERVDQRADVFSLGVMIYELLTGHVPFSGTTYTERIISLLRNDVTVPHSSVGGELLEAALKKCLAKEPADRFSTVAELRREIIPLIVHYQSVEREQRAAT